MCFHSDYKVFRDRYLYLAIYSERDISVSLKIWFPKITAEDYLEIGEESDVEGPPELHWSFYTKKFEVKNPLNIDHICVNQRNAEVWSALKPLKQRDRIDSRDYMQSEASQRKSRIDEQQHSNKHCG